MATLMYGLGLGCLHHWQQDASQGRRFWWQ